MSKVRRVLSAALALLLAAVPPGGAAAQDAGAASDRAEIAAAVQGIEQLLLDVDKMIVDQETRLDALYERREAAVGDPARQSVEMLIDRLTLQLDQAEDLRATLMQQAVALQAALDSLENDPTPAGESDD